jgi:hypothetical protein
MFAQRLRGPCANCKMYDVMPDATAFDYIPGSPVLR